MGTRSAARLTAADAANIQGEVRALYPDLVIVFDDGVIRCTGSCPVYGESRVVLDRFAIQLDVPLDFPSTPPRLYELSGRIPKTRDRHFDASKGDKACVFVEDAWPWLAVRYSTVLAFLQGPVNDFFVWQWSFDRYGEDRIGAWAHGDDGRLEFYQELFGVTTLSAIETALLYVSYHELKGHHECYCGSGDKIRKCHLEKLREVRKFVSPERAGRVLDEIRRFRIAKQAKERS